MRPVTPYFLLLISVTISGCVNKNSVSTAEPVRHDKWTALLQKHVSGEGYVNYEGFISDSAEFSDYLNLLDNHHPNDSWSEDEKLAFWINAYNAFTIQLILRHWPVESIKDIGGDIPFVNSAWDLKFITIEGEKYDLNNIEHGIIRKDFDEPRIHFALNCAAVSCPKLRNEAYNAEKLENQLDDQAKDYINGPKNEITESKVRLGKIFKFYTGDFTDGMTLREFVNQYSKVQIAEGTKIAYKDYDWRLNIAGHYQ